MATHQQMLSNAIGTQPVMAEEEHSAVQDNACTVRECHLEQTPVEKIAEAERRAILEAEEVAALRARFKATPTELQESETEWKKWLSKRSTLNFVSSWRDSIPKSKPEQDQAELIGEARFGKVVVAQHDKCTLCEAMESIRADPALSHEAKVQRLRRLEHTIPKLQMSTATGGMTGFAVLDEPTFEDLVSASTWEYASDASVKEKIVVPRNGLFVGMSFRPEKLESTIDIQEGHWKMSRNITKALVNSVEGDKEILDEVSNQETFEEHSRAVKQRVNQYKSNKDAARAVLASRLDHVDTEKAAKAKADAVELERDLAMLQSTLNATRARLEQIKGGNGRSVLEFNKKFCEMRRYKWNAGIDMEEEGIRYRPLVPEPAVKVDNSPFGVIRKMRDEYQDQRSLRGSPPPPSEELPRPDTPPAQSTPVDSPERQSEDSRAQRIMTRPTEMQIEERSTAVVLTELPENLIDGPNPFAKTMQEFNKYTREEEHYASFSTDSNPFGPVDALNVVSTTYQAAGPSTGVATAASAKDKGKAKKDSKVDGLLQEDGISLKDFAPEVNQKKGRPLRKLSVKAGSSSRPKTDPSSRPAWKH